MFSSLFAFCYYINVSPPCMFCCLDLAHGLVINVTDRVMTTCDSTCKNNPSEDKEATGRTNIPGGRRCLVSIKD